MQYAKTILDLIGNTPLVKINRLNPSPSVTILAKLEYLNPGGSIKDRIALSMIETAEKSGKLKKGSTVVEATSGNTGIGLAMVSAVKGYKAIFTQPDWMSKEKRAYMEAFGADIVVAPTAVPIDDPRGYKSTAKKIAKQKGAFLADQYSNRANPDIHYKTTGPEIWEATKGKIDVFVAGIGTGGTINGVAKFLKEKNPKIKIVVVDPIGSIISGGKLGPFFVEGIGHIFFAKNVDLKNVDEFIRIKSEDAVALAKEIIQKEGIPAGPSSGAILYGAQRVAKRAKKGSVIVALFPDSGERYLSYLYDEYFEVPDPSKKGEKKGFATDSIHAFVHDYQVASAVVPPIFQTSTFKFKSTHEAAEIFSGGSAFDKKKDTYVYTRGSHPPQRLLEKLVSKLEYGHDGVAFSSGMAAITALSLAILQKGDHAVVADVVYGETHHLFSSFLKKRGILATFVDTSDVSKVTQAIRKNTKLIFIETPANPLLKISDISEISKIAQKKKVIFAVDNTFATPYLQNPLKLGADIVVHSMTKYLGGHSDVLGGIVIGDAAFCSKVRQVLFTTGAVLDPFAAWLILRGIKTLSIRVEKTCKNALSIAQFLKLHPSVSKVYYPGLLSHPQYKLAKKQMRDFGGVISFEVKGGVEIGRKLVDSLKLCTLAVSLGAVETLVQHPASMTHAIIPKKDRLKSGITDGLVRISVGIEDVDDIISDLKQALDQLVG